MTFVPQANPKGELEYRLRRKYEAAWKALPNEEKWPYIRRAFIECAMDDTFGDKEFIKSLIEIYAWTMFAEEQDPREAKFIRNAG